MNEEQFNFLLKNLKQMKEKEKKELEENDLFWDFDEEREEVYVMIWKNLYIFDRKGYALFEKLWSKGCLKPNKTGYLCVKDDWGDLIPVHNYLKREDVEILSKKLRCPTKDIHVHHIDKVKGNNFLNNLEVLHKDEHAKRHGNFENWGDYQKWRNEKE